MRCDDVIALLEQSLNPDLLILLDDGDFFIEHNPACCFDSGGGWLQRRWPNDLSRHNAHQVLGTYQKSEDGLWLAVLSPAPGGNEVAENQTKHSTRNRAIASLWLNRHKATCSA